MAKFEITGFEDSINFFEELGEEVEKVEDQALKAGGEVIKKHQIDNVNRSGKNQPHIQENITVGRPKETDEGKLVEVGPNRKVAWRAKFLEYGTTKMPAYPFIEKSGDQGENEAVNAMEKVFMGAIKG